MIVGMLFTLSCARKLLAMAMALVLSAVAPAAAQPAKAPSLTSLDQLLTFFYQDPQPARLVGFLDEFGKSTANWGAYPPLVGLLAVVFRAHPDWIGRLVPATCDPKVADAVAAALRLAGQDAMTASLQTCLQARGDATLAAALAGLPSRLEDLRITTPTHLDLLWGASFASGDGRYAGMIAEFFARTANRSQAIAVDIVQVVGAMTGGPKDILGQLKGRYGEEMGREIVFAASALWALASNSRQHPFVAKAVAAYVVEHPGTPATMVLSRIKPGQKPT